jgi:hypothetical protein
MSSVLPNGTFQNWLVHAVQVKREADGGRVVIAPPCDVVLDSSNPCEADGASPDLVIPQDSPLYREIGKLDAKDFAVVSGKIIGKCPATAKRREAFIIELDSIFKLTGTPATAMRR